MPGATSLRPAVSVPGRARVPGARAARAQARRAFAGRRTRWGSAERRTLAIGVFAAAGLAGVLAVEVGRVWRKGSAPLPQEAETLLAAAEEAVVETVEVAVVGYQDVSVRENALFNLLTAFVATFAVARGITYLLRGRRSYGPFRNFRVGHRHIHHYIPGIVIAFGSGATAILNHDERLDPFLALAFGVGMGLTLDESALLLELEDVYWTREGLVSVQITLTVTALLAALALALRFLKRGEDLVLQDDNQLELPFWRFPSPAARPSAPPAGA